MAEPLSVPVLDAVPMELALPDVVPEAQRMCIVCAAATCICSTIPSVPESVSAPAASVIAPAGAASPAVSASLGATVKPTTSSFFGRSGVIICDYDDVARVVANDTQLLHGIGGS